MYDRVGLERGSDALPRTLDLQRAGHYPADHADLAPFLSKPVVLPFGCNRMESFEMHRLRGFAIPREPGFFGGETEHRREPSDGRAEQMFEHREAGLALE